MSKQQKPFAITLDVGSSHLNKTGSWRTMRPVYVDRLPPCNKACPSGENIQGWLSLTEEKKYRQAWELLTRDNPFPAIMGRVCYHPCESICNRGQLDLPVGINSVERFIGEQGLIHNWQFTAGQDSGKKVMIIGAGPAGLAAAYHLRCFGHQVTIFEAAEKPGGMLRYGIPKYRLPREKLRAEIYRIERMGVEIKLCHAVTDIDKTRDEGGFDAVLLCVGAQHSHMIEFDGEATIPVLDALKVLRDTEEERPNQLIGRVLVYGGGNSAMDVARTAIRMGAQDVTVISRNEAANMSAHPFEIQEAIEEGAEIRNLRSIRAINGNEITLELLKSSEIEQVGKPKTVKTGNYETLQADIVVLAIGQLLDEQLFQHTEVRLENQRLSIDDKMQTSQAGIFAAGDAVPSPRSVTHALGTGKKAARAIHAWLNQQVYQPAPQNEVASFDKMEPWYYSDALRTVQPHLDSIRRKNGFAEVVGDLDCEHGTYEARRCMSCGNCFECDNCYGICPDNAITKLGVGKGFEFKYDYCKGCGMCEAECPCGAITMLAEDI
ncbi:MAG: NAD(P)-binding protein [gamma proteobacterium symbiont of Bathyaustriella thionipta]|nr:NAD(P)-binding protein [gamma proteobacterium symbiont of Bathyaustriella thionipta]